MLFQMQRETVTSIPHPVPSTSDFLCSGRDALAMVGPDAGYATITGLRSALLDAGYDRTADELTREVHGWCRICDSPQHPCPKAAHIVHVHPELTGPPVIIPVSCKTSSCEHCGPIYAARWKDHIEEDLETWLAQPDRFEVWWFTQTWDPASHPLPFANPLSHKRVTRLLADLIRKLRKRYGYVQYTMVIEAHKSGQIHAHGFLAVEKPRGHSGTVMRTRCTAQHRGGYNRHRPESERLPRGSCVCLVTGNREPCIQQIARDLGYGINNLQLLTTATGAAKYATKRLGAYVTKTVAAHNRPRYARALRQSRHFSLKTHGAFLKLATDRYKEKHGYDNPTPGGTWHRMYDFITEHAGTNATGLLSDKGLVAAAWRSYRISIRPPPPENVQLSL